MYPLTTLRRQQCGRLFPLHGFACQLFFRCALWFTVFPHTGHTLWTLVVFLSRSASPIHTCIRPASVLVSASLFAASFTAFLLARHDGARSCSFLLSPSGPPLQCVHVCATVSVC